MARRQHLTVMLALAVTVFLTFTYFLSTSSQGTVISDRIPGAEFKGGDAVAVDQDLSPGVLSGGAIAPKLENATAKAELGRAAWKLLHTMMARFPDTPTADESQALKSYVHLFARLYPCGDCARHFQQLLVKYPPQAGSRNSAAGWACFVHNEVNRRLKKPQFDCNNIGDFYDCGCGEEGGKKNEGGVGEAAVAGGDKGKQDTSKEDKNKEAKPAKETKEAKETTETKEAKETTETKEAKETTETKETKETKGKGDVTQEDLKEREMVSLEKEEGLTRGG